MRAFEYNCAGINKHNCAGAGAYANQMQSNVTHALVDNVRRLMAHAEWTQRELAQRAGISQRAVGYLINYKDGQDRHPTTQTVEAIAVAFEIEAWQLMMPNLPLELIQSKRFTKLIENYRDAPESGRAQVERIAEGEVRYAVAESVLTGSDKTGTGG
jgi:transcriptional regulator with XRE-family HTH domain